MKKIGILVTALVLGITTIVAQPRGGQREFNPEDMAKRQTERLDEELDLSKDQEKKVYEISLEAGKKMGELRGQMRDGGFQSVRDEMGEIREQQNEKMKKVLTEAQWKKYEKYLEERRDRRGQGNRRNR